ncbi:MAG: tetratricopeptide repeat protein [Deltaproteobacteria bacterium]
MKDMLSFQFSVSKVPPGEAITSAEAEERMLARLDQRGGECTETLWSLAVLYSRTGRLADTRKCLDRLLGLAQDLEERAHCILAMGQLMEKHRDYEGAVKYYRQAFEMEPCRTEVWYFINNNLGFSLNQIGMYQEAEPYLKAAIAIDSCRPNAHKNLGLCHVGWGDFAFASRCFVVATQVNASDGRSLKHLEELVQEHPELLVDERDLAEELDACRKAVELARAQQPDWQAEWKKRRDHERHGHAGQSSGLSPCEPPGTPEKGNE